MAETGTKVCTIPVRVHTQSIFEAICRDTNIPSVPMALEIICNRLTRVADRAIEIKDDKILEELKLLGIVKEKT